MAKVLIELVKRPGVTKYVRPNEAKVLVSMGRYRYPTTAMRGGPPPRETDRFEDVDFASDVAYEAARAAGLRASAFHGRTGSGKDGAFTKADVHEIAREWA